MSTTIEHKLVAILSADAVGYSRLMGEDEEATVHTLENCRRRIERSIDTFRGRVVDAPGDNLLAEFPSAIGSVRCAFEIQKALAQENSGLSPDRRMPFRIGIHLGDVLVDGPKIYGNGINVAARLEGLAEPGAICVSDLVYQQVRRRLELDETDLGEQLLKNIAEPVRAYQIAPAADSGRVTIARAPAPKALALPDKPSLAVVPFFNLNGDPTHDYFSDGLTIDIMSELVRIPELFLIGQDSSFSYRSTGAKPREVGRELGVRHVLEGSVRREQDRIRITAQLIEAESGRHEWAERYDGKLENVFDMQDEITEQIVTALDVALVGGESARTVRAHLRDPIALGLLYRGNELIHRFNREDMIEARRLFAQVRELAPECPFGYVDAAWAHYFDVERGYSDDPEESIAQMSELAYQSLELGDISGFSYLMLGNMHLMKREHDEALAMSEKALEERPSCQAAWGLKANILNYCGNPQDAIPLAKKSIRLSPVAQTFFPEVLATAYYLSGRHEEAMSAAYEALSIAPDSVDALIVVAASLVETGRVEAASEIASEILSIDPDFSLSLLNRSRPYRDPAVLERLTKSLESAGLKRSRRGKPAEVIELSTHAAARRRVRPRPRH